MNVLHAMGLKDVLQFKSQKFEFPKGVSVIYGLNQVEGRNSGNGNAAGKSLFFSQLAEIVYDDPIVGEKADRTRTGKRVLSFTSHTGKQVVVSREGHGRKEIIGVQVDGVDKEYLTPTKAKEYLRRLFPINQDEYNTYVHLDSRVPHPLVMGSSTERKRFFTNFFPLGKMDAERKLYAAELAKLKKTRAAFNELRAAYDSAKEDLLSEDAVAEIEERLNKTRKKIKKLQRESESGAEVIRLLRFIDSSKEQIEQLAVALANDWSHDSYDTAVKDNDYAYDRAKSDLRDARAWEEYQKDASKYNNAVEALSKKTRRFVKEHGMRKATKIAVKKANELESEMRAIGDVPDIDKLEAEIKKLKALTAEEPKRPDVDRGELETLIRAYRHQLQHAKKFKEGTCDTCGSVVKIKDPSELKDKIDKVQRKIDRHDEADAHADNVKRLRQLKTTLKETRAFLEVEARLRPYADIAEELTNLPDAPTPFEGRKLQVSVMERVWDEVKDRRRLLEFFRPHIEDVIAAANLTDAQKAEAKAAVGHQEAIARLQDRTSKDSAKLQVHETVSGRVKAMRRRLKEMKAELAEEEALKLLVEAYSDKQMKKMAVEAISSHLMKIVNKYAKLVFPEDYKFAFEWGTQLNLLVYRKYKKKTIVSDVRKLSGAEAKLFTVVLVLALLAFVPKHKRCSLMILDEPTANFSKETIQSFQELLPVLNQIIPSIVIITPKSDEVYEGAHAFTVIKNAGVATIVKGHPATLRSAQ